MHMSPKHERRAVRQRIQAARAEAEELLEQRRQQLRRELEERMREMADDRRSAA